VLWKALEDQAVAQFVKAHFHLVEIDTGQYFVGPDSPEPKNIDIAKTYGVDLRNEGIPTLIPLTPEAKTIPTDRHVKWSNARNFSVADVLAYLKEMAKLANAKPARG
jgi:hypothetical protein